MNLNATTNFCANALFIFILINIIVVVVRHLKQCTWPPTMVDAIRKRCDVAGSHIQETCVQWQIAIVLLNRVKDIKENAGELSKRHRTTHGLRYLRAWRGLHSEACALEEKIEEIEDERAAQIIPLRRGHSALVKDVVACVLPGNDENNASMALSLPA
ncbi:hypothetical protein BDZ89DRAFT_1172564 [Hymenopellis radicata]|nr:hypothetical protein BDZ89DRAFT_1172564 [Hymenopellis radicata]